MEDFKRISGCKHKIPDIHEIEPFCIRKGGKYNGKQYNLKQKRVCIMIEKYKRFSLWFESMSNIIGDLRELYDKKNIEQYVLIGLFYDRKSVERLLENQQIGTFILRISAKQNGLVISYKNAKNKILHTLLTRIGEKYYVVGSNSAKEGYHLSQIILVWSELSFVYHPMQLLKKETVFDVYMN